MSWSLVVALVVGAFGFKVFGVMVLGHRTAGRVGRAVAIVPAALFAAIVALETFQRDESVVVDARVVGLVTATLTAWRKLPFAMVVVSAMAATAAARAVF